MREKEEDKSTYVVSYRVDRFKFGTDLVKLNRSVRRLTNYVKGSMVFFRIRKDGSWEPIDLPQKGVENEN